MGQSAPDNAITLIDLTGKQQTNLVVTFGTFPICSILLTRALEGLNSVDFDIHDSERNLISVAG